MGKRRINLDGLLKKLKKYGIEYVDYCSCGAFTFQIGSKNYSVHKDNLHNFFNGEIDETELLGPEAPLVLTKMYNCNHCVNHWGLDLCACGSGESPEECDNGYRETCGKPLQVLDIYHINAYKDIGA